MLESEAVFCELFNELGILPITIMAPGRTAVSKTRSYDSLSHTVLQFNIYPKRNVCFCCCVTAADIVAAAASQQGDSCPEQVEPVCGEDGLSYHNGCLAKAQKVTVLHEGYCKGEEACLSMLLAHAAAAHVK
jgi:hypothetical protein